MNDSTKRQFQEADAAADKAIAAFIGKIKFDVREMGRRRASVHP